MSILRLWVIGTVLLAVVVVAIGWFVGVQPRLADAANADAQRREVATLNEGYEATLRELQQLSENLPALRDQLDELRIEIPDAPELPALLGQLQSLADAAGAELNEVTANQPYLVEGLDGTGVTDLVAIPITVSATGGDESLSEYLRQVQTGPRLFLVSAFSFQVEEDAGRVSFDGVVYVLPEDGAELPVVGEEGAVGGTDPSPAPSAEPSTSPSP